MYCNKATVCGGIVGLMEPFDSTEMSWSDYCTKFELFLSAIGIKDEARKRSLLLTFVGKATYSLLLTLVPHADVMALSYNELKEVLSTHFMSTRDILLNRICFRNRVKHDSESMSDYIAALHQLASSCNFMELHNTIRDHLLFGLQDTDVYEKLLSHPNLTLADAEAITLAAVAVDSEKKSEKDYVVQSEQQSEDGFNRTSQNICSDQDNQENDTQKIPPEALPQEESTVVVEATCREGDEESDADNFKDEENKKDSDCDPVSDREQNSTCQDSGTQTNPELTLSPAGTPDLLARTSPYHVDELDAQVSQCDSEEICSEFSDNMVSHMVQTEPLPEPESHTSTLMATQSDADQYSCSTETFEDEEEDNTGQTNSTCDIQKDTEQEELPSEHMSASTQASQATCDTNSSPQTAEEKLKGIMSRGGGNSDNSRHVRFSFDSHESSNLTTTAETWAANNFPKERKGILPAGYNFGGYAAKESHRSGSKDSRETNGKHYLNMCKDSLEVKINVPTLNPGVFSMKVKVRGKDIPQPLKSFAHMDLSHVLAQSLKIHNIKVPTSIQSHVIPIVIQDRDLLLCAPRGLGKTMAYLLPILNATLGVMERDRPAMKAGPIVLVLSPTREEATRIYYKIMKLTYYSHMKTVLLCGKINVNDQASKLEAGCHVLVASPGRLVYFMEREKVSFQQIKCLVTVDASRMLDEVFTEDIDKILQHDSMPPKSRRLNVLLATMVPDENIQSLFLQDNFVSLSIGGGANVIQTFYQLNRAEKKDKLLQILTERKNTDHVVIFVGSKRSADALPMMLLQNGFCIDGIHSDSEKILVDRAVGKFINGRMPILVTTSFALSLNLKEVAPVHIINYDMPRNIEEYLRRLGLTRCLGTTAGRAISFVDCSQDAHLIDPLVHLLKDEGDSIPDFLIQLAKQGRSSGPSGDWDPPGSSECRSTDQPHEKPGSNVNTSSRQTAS